MKFSEIPPPPYWVFIICVVINVLCMMIAFINRDGRFLAFNAAIMVINVFSAVLLKKEST